MTKTGLPRLMGPYNGVLTLTLLVLWLLPITYVGAMKRDVAFFPSWLRHQHRISCLFTNEVNGWTSYFVEVQSGGSPDWSELDMAGYFDLPVFGYRSRLHRILSHAQSRGGGVKRVNEITQYIQRRYAEKNPGKPPLDAVRFVRTYMNLEMLATQTGCFKPFRPEEVPDSYVRVFGENRFDGKRATHSGLGRSRSRAKAQPPSGNQVK